MKGEKGRVAVTSRGPDEYSQADESFGRAYWFLIYDEHEGQWESIDNSRIRESPGGAGLSAAEAMQAAGVSVVITGETGPKAYRALSEAGIQVCYGVAGTVLECYQAHAEGKTIPASTANNKCNPFCLVNGGNKTQPSLNWFQGPERITSSKRR